MTATYQLNRPEDMLATVTISAKVSEWKKLLEVLNAAPDHWPMGDLRSSVRQCIAAAEKHFTEYDAKA